MNFSFILLGRVLRPNLLLNFLYPHVLWAFSNYNILRCSQNVNKHSCNNSNILNRPLSRTSLIIFSHFITLKVIIFGRESPHTYYMLYALKIQWNYFEKSPQPVRSHHLRGFICKLYYLYPTCIESGKHFLIRSSVLQLLLRNSLLSSRYLRQSRSGWTS